MLTCCLNIGTNELFTSKTLWHHSKKCHSQRPNSILCQKANATAWGFHSNLAFVIIKWISEIWVIFSRRATVTNECHYDNFQLHNTLSKASAWACCQGQRKSTARYTVLLHAIPKQNPLALLQVPGCYRWWGLETGCSTSNALKFEDRAVTAVTFSRSLKILHQNPRLNFACWRFVT